MNKKFWDLYAPIYEKAMRPDSKTYQAMYDRIPEVIKGRDVLEIATGPGLLAKHVAPAARTMIATDYSAGMIREARKGDCPANLTFEVADATALPYPDARFDVVLIANALHLIPDVAKAQREILRVLKPGGVLIAPNFIEHGGTWRSRLWNRVLHLAGVRFERQWDAGSYRAWLEANGWRVVTYQVMSARIPIAYAECVRTIPLVSEPAGDEAARLDAISSR